MDRMRTWMVALAAAVLLGCGGDTGPRVVDPLLLPYVEEFEAAAGFPVSSSVLLGDVPFGPPGSKPDGVCHISGSDRLVVVTDYMTLTSADTGERYIPEYAEWFYRVLIFHELGHCELGKQHDAVHDPVGIMHPGASAFAGLFMEDWDHYVALLFGHDG